MSPSSEADSQASATDSSQSSGAASGEQPGAAPASHQKMPRPQWVLQSLLVFLSSAVLFLSAFFAVAAPIPLILLNLVRGRKWALLAATTNAVIVFLLAGPVSLGLYLTFTVSVGFVLPELLRRGTRIEWTVLASMGSIIATGALMLGALALIQARGMSHPILELKNEVASVVDQLGQAVSSQLAKQSGLVSKDEVQEAVDAWKKSLVEDFPSSLGIFSLVLVWLNLSVTLRANPARVREKLKLAPGGLRAWKSPEWLVWPTIAVGAISMFAPAPWTLVGSNLLKFFLAVYALQGVAILASVMDRVGIRGLLRPIIFCGMLFFALPLLLGVGFFDLWFDFRAKLRQK